MRVIVGADHGGFETKIKLLEFLMEKGVEVVDVGANEKIDTDDYVDYATKAVLQMNEADRAILLCRNGMGMCIVANKFKGVRCGLGFGLQGVRKGRSDDDINALALPVDYISFEAVKEMVDIFLETPFSTEERYIKRILKINELEKKW
jgi:RpiB/LacA/LacB family sugar-phosphate isomerase